MPERRVLYLGRQLLDHQIVTNDAHPVGKVDDLELETERRGAPIVTGLLSGQIILGHRIGGRLGGWVSRTAERLRAGPDDGPRRFDITNVKDIDHTVVLGSPYGETRHAPLEVWTREHVVTRIPGA